MTNNKEQEISKQKNVLEKQLNRLEKLFYNGYFTEVELEYEKILSKNPENFEAIFYLGNLALLENNFVKSEKLLKKALEKEPENKEVITLLAQTYYRQDKFKEALPYYEKVGNEGVIAKIKYLSKVEPYKITSQGNIQHTSIKFIQTDPLPVLEMKINGKKGLFLIDTGGSELIIKNDFAKILGIKSMGNTTAVFAGERTAQIGHGILDVCELGEFTIKNIPVNIHPLPSPGPLKVVGIIGTIFLYHFISTINYKEGSLDLVLKTEEAHELLDKRILSKNFSCIPFWHAASHILLAWGKVNNSEDQLFFVDTGLAGGGFTCPKSTIEKLSIKLDEAKTFEGVGGGGMVKGTPFMIDCLSLGDITRSNIHGVYIHGTETLNLAKFNIDGIISHMFFRPYILTFDFQKMKIIIE